MLLSINDVSKSYEVDGRAVAALSSVSLELAPGRFVALKGRSGCGKSTLLLSAGGLLRPDGGSVRWGNIDIYALSPEERAALRAREVGFVFQQFHLVPYLSVLENVLAATLGLSTDATPATAHRAHELIDRFGLSDRVTHRPSQLSVGERQRTALARALLNRPQVILADEPTGNLDAQSAAVVLDELASFAHAGGAVLLVTHEAEAAARADECLNMEAGRLVGAAAAAV
ncbi:MAG: ABC transporter ATP-binding protein [Planctomycetes bacterium]|nr:ABC transporter ATP-binding protein [Planctomycetota bacterium]